MEYLFKEREKEREKPGKEISQNHIEQEKILKISRTTPIQFNSNLISSILILFACISFNKIRWKKELK